MRFRILEQLHGRPLEQEMKSLKAGATHKDRLVRDRLFGDNFPLLDKEAEDDRDDNRA